MASRIAIESFHDAFVAQLTGFDLTEQEAECYYYLLKDGPKMHLLLAEDLSVSRDEIDNILAILIEKNMVRPTVRSPDIYAAADLSFALEAAMHERANELRDMKVRGQELIAYFHQHSLHPPADVSTFKMLKNVRELASVAISTLLSTEQEFSWIAPEKGLALADACGINSVVEELYERGVSIRGVTNITKATVPLVQELIEIGEDVRHLDRYRGVYYALFDGTHSMSAIDIDIKRLAPHTSARAFYANDSKYASYLSYFFELVWKQSVPAEQRIQELLGCSRDGV